MVSNHYSSIETLITNPNRCQVYKIAQGTLFNFLKKIETSFIDSFIYTHIINLINYSEK